MFLLLIACSANQSAESVTLARQAPLPLEGGGIGYDAVAATRAGCRSSDWQQSTLENALPSFGSASSSQGLCQHVGMTWANTEPLDEREEIVLSLNDWSSSYPIVLGNWPTAARNLVPEASIASGELAGNSVGFEMEGPGVLNPELQVVLHTFDGTWLLPQDGGAVRVGEDSVVIDFPAEISSPVELIFEQAWPATVLEGEDALPFALEFAPNDGGQSFDILAVQP